MLWTFSAGLLTHNFELVLKDLKKLYEQKRRNTVFKKQRSKTNKYV